MFSENVSEEVSIKNSRNWRHNYNLHERTAGGSTFIRSIGTVDWTIAHIGISDAIAIVTLELIGSTGRGIQSNCRSCNLRLRCNTTTTLRRFVTSISAVLDSIAGCIGTNTGSIIATKISRTARRTARAYAHFTGFVRAVRAINDAVA